MTTSGPDSSTGGTLALKGRSALVTGAARGIGAATARALAEQGASVGCLDVTGAEAAAVALQADGFRAFGVTHDVRDSASWGAVVARAREAHGPVDILVNNAAVRSPPDSAVDQRESDWDRVIDVNLKGVWLGMKAVLPEMIAAESGRIINISSLAAVIGMMNLLTYSASKGGVVAMTRQVAIEYAEYGITANSIGPGITDTPGMNESNTPEMSRVFSAAVPLKRLGRSAEPAALAAFLAGPDGGYITGQFIPIDGGWSAH
jgi:NAD(P)-dependent dehydrogenase (short-subunit alcohol dehydrogenase family)